MTPVSYGYVAEDLWISIINIIRYIYREHEGYMIYIYIIPIYDEYYRIYWEQNRELGS